MTVISSRTIPLVALLLRSPLAAKALVLGVRVRGEREVGAPQGLGGQGLRLPGLALGALTDERIGEVQPRT